MNPTAQMASGTANLPVIIALFDTAKPAGAAYGLTRSATWDEFAALTKNRREGEKDGKNVVPAQFKLESDGSVRRLKANLVARTIVALDCELNKQTGEVPPSIETAIRRIKVLGWAALVYTSHNHTADAPRFRIFVPLTTGIDPALPAVEVVAGLLGLEGVLDTGKIGASSLFYLPSAARGCLLDHREEIVAGDPIDAAWMQAQASAILNAREERQAAERAAAQAEAERRMAAKVAAGFKPTDHLIEAIRDRLDLAAELLKHGYTKVGDRYLYPGSETGMPGVHILRGGDGVERVFSHHSGDPLASGNLPSWCRVKAVDAVDVVTILDFGGDQTRALHDMATRFGIGEPMKVRAIPDEPPGFADIPPADNDHGAASDHAASMPGDTADAVDQTKSRPMTWAIINPVDLQHRVIPERQWIVQDWLPIGVTTANYGDGGTGKTLLAQQLMTSAATGLGWCGYEVMQCRSLGLFCEDDQDELHRRQERMCASLGADMGQLEAMRWISGVGCDNALVAFTADGRMRKTDQWDTLEKHAVRHGARLIVLDTAADLFTGNENDRNQVRQFIGALNGLALQINGAVLLNAHPSRTGLTTGNLDGGSTAWSNSVRSRWSLARPTGDGEDLDTPERVLTRRKANYAAAGEAIRLRWQDGVLTAPARPTGFSAMARNVDAEAVFLVLLAATAREGRHVSENSRAATYAPKEFGKRQDRQGFAARDFDGAMERLFTAGRIRVEEYGKSGGHGRARHIVAV